MPLPPFLKTLENDDPVFAAVIERVFTAAMGPGALDQKTKLLIALALDAAHGSDHQLTLRGRFIYAYRNFLFLLFSISLPR